MTTVSATTHSVASATRIGKLGIYPEHWAGDVSDDGADFGERP